MPNTRPDTGANLGETAIDAALRTLASHHASVVLADGTPTPVRILLARARPMLVASVHPTVVDAAELVVFIPEETNDAMQLLVSARELDHADMSQQDRYLAYHSRAESSNWIAADIDACRWEGEVFDQDDLAAAMNGPGRMLADEPALLRNVNGDASIGIALATQAGLRDVEHAVVVGGDPWGVDVRAGTHLRRVEFESPVHDADAALHSMKSIASASDQ